MTYTLNAFDHELIVGETSRGTWTGGIPRKGFQGLIFSGR